MERCGREVNARHVLLPETPDMIHDTSHIILTPGQPVPVRVISKEQLATLTTFINQRFEPMTCAQAHKYLHCLGLFRGWNPKLSCRMTKPTKLPVRPVKIQQPGHLPSDQSFRCPHEETLGPLPIEHTVNTLIRLGGCPG